MNPEKHKITISKEISKRIKVGIVIPTSVLVALAGTGCAQQSKSIIVESESETQVSQQTPPQKTQESPTVAQTEIQEKVKEFEEIKVEILTDPSFRKITKICQELNDAFGQVKIKVPQVKEVVFKDQERGPKMLEKAILLTWAYSLGIRMDPDLKDIPKENTDLLISTLIKKYEAGEDLTFDINISEDNRNAYYINETRSMHKVDFSKGVTIKFVGEINEERLPTHQANYGSREFFPTGLINFKDGSTHVGSGVKLEISDDGKLTMSLYMLNFTPEAQAGFVGSALEAIITQDYYCNENRNYSKYLDDSLFEGNKWEGDRKIEYGKPALEVITEQ